MHEPVVEMLGITKRFPGIVANDHIDLVVRKGEIHALLGENGAGKSTLMNILFGLYQPDEGVIRIRGNEVKIQNPNQATRLGIGMVHQHFMLVEPFTVLENIVLGEEPKRFGFFDRKKAEAEVRALSERYGLHVDPHAKISEISVGQQQRVEILKTLYRGAEILIFDEPTAVLTPQEIQELMDIMRSLVKEGKSIVFITHKLKEIMAVCDRVTIIRRGKFVDCLDIQSTNPDDLAAKMVGRHVNFEVTKAPVQPKEVVLKLADVHAMGNRGVEALKGINLEVRAGEIVGIAGVEGNGQSELIEVITGLRKPTQGTIELDGQPVMGWTPRQLIESGIGHIPEDRHKRGLVLDFTVAENIALQTYYRPPFANNGILQKKEIEQHAERVVNDFDVRTPSLSTPIRALSGGNQQKAIIGREVERDPRLLIAAQPTRGLDVGAIEFIHESLIKQRDNGKAVLLVSLELDEILRLSDRIAVIYEGKIVKIVNASDVTEQELGLYMAGGQKDRIQATKGES